LAVYGIRTSVSVTTGYSPYELVYGIKPRLPIDAMFALKEDEMYEGKHDEYVKNLKLHLSNLQQKASFNIKNAKINQKIQFDKKAKFQVYEIGDLVMFYEMKRNEKGLKKKYLRNWTGPHIVVRKLNQKNYVIVMKQTGIEKTVNVYYLKHFVSRDIKDFKDDYDVNEELKKQVEIIKDIERKPKENMDKKEDSRKLDKIEHEHNTRIKRK